MSKKLTINEFVENAKKVHGKKYDYEKINYINNATKIIIICPIHGEFKQIPRNHIYLKRGCPRCGLIKAIKTSDRQRLTINRFIEKARLIHGNKYDYSKVMYKNDCTKINLLCIKCGAYFKQKPRNHLNNEGCPVCKSSKGEYKINLWLSTNNIKFIIEKSFKNLRGIGGGPLRFDFYLPDHNICIEYDSKQHFDKKFYDRYFGKYMPYGYDALKLHDKMKNAYCKNNFIKLIRIPYNKFKEINKILNAYFNFKI